MQPHGLECFCVMHALHCTVREKSLYKQHGCSCRVSEMTWETQRVRIVATGAAPADSGSGAPKERRWGKGRPYHGRVVAMEGLCNLSKADDKDTVRVEVDLGDSGLRYVPGDALGILPANCPQVPGRRPNLSIAHHRWLACIRHIGLDGGAHTHCLTSQYWH